MSKHPCQKKENNNIFITFNWLLLIRELGDYVDDCCSDRNGTSPAVSYGGVNTYGHHMIVEAFWKLEQVA